MNSDALSTDPIYHSLSYLGYPVESRNDLSPNLEVVIWYKVQSLDLLFIEFSLSGMSGTGI